ncbi:amidohydrolase family protein [Candidatus Bathyarchaeota archaeon]|nr:amidohydrolase family protein [Candidatus Bathyarchaeota archaeon]
MRADYHHQLDRGYFQGRDELLVDIIIKHGKIFESSTGTTHKGDIGIKNGQIVSIAEELPLDGKIIVDASGKLVLPGFIDLHVHLRDMNQLSKETIRTGTRAAIHGGVTTVFAMPNTDPPLNLHHVFDDYSRLVQEQAYCNVGLYCGYPPLPPSQSLGMGQQEFIQGNTLHGSPGEELAMLKDKGAMAVKIYMERSISGHEWNDDATLRSSLQEIITAGLPVHVHPGLSRDGKRSKADFDRMLDSGLNPLEAHDQVHSVNMEAEGLDRLLALTFQVSEGTGIVPHVHACHVSCKEALEVVKRWKLRDGINVSCEVTPHHLLLSHDMFKGDETKAKVLQPLREATQRECMTEALRCGDLDIIASDHAPHTLSEKLLPFTAAPSGFPSLDIYAPLLLDRLLGAGFTLADIITRCCIIPATMASLDHRKGRIIEGHDADLILVKQIEPRTVNPGMFESKSHLSPYGVIGCKLGWQVTDVVVHGDLQLESGAFTGQPLHKLPLHRKIVLE